MFGSTYEKSDSIMDNIIIKSSPLALGDRREEGVCFNNHPSVNTNLTQCHGGSATAHVTQ